LRIFLHGQRRKGGNDLQLSKNDISTKKQKQTIPLSANAGCPVERLNGKRYADNWLENLLVATSAVPKRKKPPLKTAESGSLHRSIEKDREQQAGIGFHRSLLLERNLPGRNRAA